MVALLALIFSAFASATAAPTAKAATTPKVVFIGDYVTYQWASAFAANPNWINEGSPNTDAFGGGGVGLTGNFQTDVVDQHPAIVHIMIGADFAYFVSDESALFLLPGFLNYLDSMVKQAQAANIKVILGTSPPLSVVDGNDGYLPEINSVTAAYGAAHNIPVIDYADAMCGCPSLSTDWFGIRNVNGTMNPPVPPVLPGQVQLPSTAGYAVMTQLAENVIPTVGLKLVTGWLSNTVQGEGSAYPPINVNTASPPQMVLFTPIGYYSDGSQHPMINTNMQDATGTWTSSDPTVMYINQQGFAWAISNGTTIIRYTSPTGVSFSEWVMNVIAPTG
jgi:hypothetical protein